MNRLILLAVLLLAGPAWAQPPEIVEPEDRIELGVGKSKTLVFQQSFKSFDAAIPGVVKFLPQSNRQLTVTGAEVGTTLMFIHDEQERVIYTATVTVALSSGHLVKIYGHRNKDFRGYYCSETGCGRADLDKRLANGGRDPDEPVAVTTTQRTGDGGSITRQYQPN